MIKIGIIGCGIWGMNFLRIFSEVESVHVVGCADADESLREKISNRFPGVKMVTDAAFLLEMDIEAVVISTPAGTHLELAMEVLRSGRHLLIEKPLATTVRGAEKISKLADERNLILMVDHTFLYNDSVRTMKRILASKNAGDIYYLYARRNHLGTIRDNLSVMWDLAPHDISIFSYLLEKEPLWVSATGGTYLKSEHNDVTFMTLGYPDGVLGNIQVSWVDSSKVREVVAISSKCRVVFDDLNPMESLRIFEKGISVNRDLTSYGEFKYLLRDGDIRSPKIEFREPLKNVCENFIECVQEGKRPLTDGPAGIQVVRILEAASRSIAKSGFPVQIGKMDG